MAKEWKRCVIDTFNIDDFYDYSSYDEWLEDNAYNEEDITYDDFLLKMRELDMDDFHCNLLNSPLRYGNYFITGTLGFWNGNYTICGVYSNDLYDAVCRCIGGCYDFKVYETNYGLEVHNMHHDGTNIFYIRPLSKKGCKKVDMMDYKDVEWKEEDFLHPKEKDFYIF